MPRRACIDAPGALHHVVMRGIEGKAIFKDNTERENFIERLSSWDWLASLHKDAHAISRYRSVRGHRRCVPLSWHRRGRSWPAGLMLTVRPSFGRAKGQSKTRNCFQLLNRNNENSNSIEINIETTCPFSTFPYSTYA